MPWVAEEGALTHIVLQELMLGAPSGWPRTRRQLAKAVMLTDKMQRV